MKIHETLDAYIDAHTSEATAFLQSLIQEKSVQGNELGVQQLVTRKLESLGLRPDVWEPNAHELDGHPYYIPSRPAYKGSPNVVAVWKGTGGGKSIILNGHVDVVPEGDTAKWTQPPFGGTIVDGKMYGRGTTDMKGGNVSLMLALESLIRTGVRLKGDVIFESVVEEESGGTGTLATVLRGYKADAALIPEPTNMKLFVKQQGSMWFRITVEGRSAHGGTRYEGVSAIEKAILVHQAVLELEKKRNSRINDPLYAHIPIPVPINMGKIQGGSWPSSVADLVTVEGRIGVAPHESMQAVKDELKETLERVSAGDPWLKDHPVRLEFFGGQWVPNQLATDHPFTEVVVSTFEEIYHRPIAVEASPWGTDGGLLGRVGEIPTLVIGPGETRVAHYPDEFIQLSEVVLAARYFARIIAAWCEPTAS
ncbi:MAG: peptidase [Cyclobacteriaceae bacterium]|nr:peptidase [Cyclobacteriaceae bacterium]